MSHVWEPLLALGVGVLSAVVPVVNAELAAVAVGSLPTLAAVLSALALALGQTAGKLVLFEGGRRGSARWERLRGMPRWVEQSKAALAARRTSVPLVLASSGIGLPPLAVVSVVAGAAGMGRVEFAALCFIGRAVRFVGLALSLSWLLPV